ncbi:Dienelactone hydrolase endo-1,3,1,4-beta-D-glucanase [Mycena chlorophos]|uniref:Dienelactone hydrolase endo-1,3,1,4-beta-D-glucanase n=1 Tax=Mycena chlorophos TaxID=658473 RepID=A0A8H6SU22_MYCCL|nr:Dienelactone hydrolase endo-1,3,1,4-beta-D-glucanase [Mycena chlorophos]
MPVLRPHELNSKGQLMIKLFNVAIRPCDAARLPDDTWLEIMLACTPRELLAMQFVSRRFRRILAENPHTWPAARNNMSPPVPPPPKYIEASGVWSEAAYAQFIFGGGHCVVKPCKKFTMEFPLSFALRIRVCSLHCKNVLAREYDKVGRKIQNAYLTSMGIPGRRGLRKMGQTQRLHFRSWLVYDERELTLHRTYRVSTLAEADQEWWAARALTERRPVKPQVKVLRSVPQLQRARDQWLLVVFAECAFQEYALRAKALPEIMANAMALQKWVQEYQVARKETELANVKFVRTTISPREQLQYRKLLNTPTAKAMMKVYGDSLGKIDLRAWCSARAQIISEYKTALAKSKKERAEKEQAEKEKASKLEVVTQPAPETIPEVEPESASEPVVVIPRHRVQLDSLGSGLAVPQSRLSRDAAARYRVLKEILFQRKQTRDLEADKENRSMSVGPDLDAKPGEKDDGDKEVAAPVSCGAFPTGGLEGMSLARRLRFGDEEEGAVGAEGRGDNGLRSEAECFAADSTFAVYDDLDGGSDDSGMTEGLFATSTPRACSPDHVPASHRYGYEDLTDYGSEDEEEGSEM